MIIGETILYENIDDKNLNGNLVLTDIYPEGYKDLIKGGLFSIQELPKFFVNMNTYNKISKEYNNYIIQSKSQYQEHRITSVQTNTYGGIKIKCKNVIDFSNYIEDINKKHDGEMLLFYYTLEKAEKVIYTDVLQMILQIIITTIVIIGAVSSINIINASLCEREKEFETLASLGATKKNVNKILIYENLFIFLKATVISIIISIPIINKIIEQMENIIILNKSIIPFDSILIFLIILFVISLFITLYSTKSIKIYKKD
ncbi:MAG: ABC transporter permease [Clostridia bacterium]|nr:ABC transporter permease [Clostridia bacterium]